MRNTRWTSGLFLFGLGMSMQSAQARPGDNDPTFGATYSGYKSTNSEITTSEIGGAIAIQSDGQIVGVGSLRVTPTNFDFVVGRITADGGDSPFSSNGFYYATADFGGYDIATSIASQTDNKIVAAGSSGGNFALARFNVNGTLDSSFSGDGKLTLDFGNNDTANSIALQSDGKIVTVGSSSYVNSNGRTVSDFSVARFNSNGSLDTSFSGDGKLKTQFTISGSPANAIPSVVLIQPDGRILVGGSSISTLGNNRSGDFAMARYNSNGSLDSSFGSGGVTTTDYGGDETGNGMCLQTDGKIILVGSNSGNFVTTRYNSNGSIDSSFGTSGVAVINFGFGFQAGAGAYGVAVQSNGKIVVVGGVKQEFGSDVVMLDPAMARYNSNGTLDTSFTDPYDTGPGDGKYAKYFLNTGDEARNVFILPNQKIVIGAPYDAFIKGTISVTRLLGDSSTTQSSSSTLAPSNGSS